MKEMFDVRNTRQKEIGRIEVFSNNVFAITVTLLILGINVPKADELVAGNSLVTE